MRRKWKLKGMSVLICALILCCNLPVQAEEEQIKITDKEYVVTLSDAFNLFLSNDKPVSGEIGSKVFLTYTVEKVTKNEAIQSGVIGTKDNDAAFPYVDVGRLCLSNESLLYDEGYTYVFRFERTEAGFEYQAAKLKGKKAENIFFASSTGLPLSGEEDYNYYGTWIGGLIDDTVTATLNHVRCYDEKGNDLGVHFNVSTAVNENEMNSLLNVHPVIDSSYSFSADSEDTLAISSKYPTDSDVVYMEYEVENVKEDGTYQQGVIVTSAPTATYPHGDNRGSLQFNMWEAGELDVTPLLREGGKYFICFVKEEEKYSAYVQCTIDGKTEMFSFNNLAGAYSPDYQYFSLWFGEGADFKFTADFKNVKCYDAEGNSLGIQLNQADVPLSHKGGLEDYSTTRAVYYSEATGGLVALLDEQAFTYEINGTKQEGEYTIQDGTNLYLLMEDGKVSFNYAHLQLTDEDGNVYKRMKPSTVTFVTGEEVTQVKAEAGNGFRVAEPEAPVKEGNTFKGWFLGDETAYSFDTVVTESITLYAKWQDGDGNEYLATMEENVNGLDMSMVIAIAASAILIIGSAAGCVVMVRRRKNGTKKR